MTFVCDAMLGKLAKYLRILGLDAPFAGTRGRLPRPGPSEPYYFLTRRRSLKAGQNVVFIRSDHAREQVKEILDIIRPSLDMTKVMTRCIACNVSLVDMPKTDAERHVPEFVYHQYETFRMCPSCGKVYWEGTHATHMSAFIEEIFYEHPME